MIKRVMFIVAMALIMSFEPAQGSGLCLDYADLSKNIMASRQAGYSEAKTIRTILRAGGPDMLRKLAVETVAIAYRAPIQHDPYDASLAVARFKSDMLNYCNDTLKGL